jgi:hypothetical protein
MKTNGWRTKDESQYQRRISAMKRQLKYREIHEAAENSKSAKK